MKESVQKFDLEAAFKALDEVEIPVVKGIRPNRENLQEKFTRKLTSEILVEDYFDVSDTGELEQASEEREAEIAKAKLARIEKIVDLDAESEEDLLPSYVGKLIMQCPQCMTLFYKNEEDIEKSEENPDVVNLNEPCQHCGNTSGYTLVGKVDTVGEEEASEFDVEDFDENELNLDFEEEPAEEEEVEEPAEEAATEEEEELDLEPIEDEESEEEVKESLREDWDTEVANADKRLAEIIKESDNEQYDDGDGYWSGEAEWCNRYMYYANSVANLAQVEELCEKYSTENCNFYVFEDDAEEDPVSEIGYTLVRGTNEALNEATIYMTKAEMAKLDKEVEDARKEVAKYNLPMKAQKNSAGQTENIPDFEAVPENQREAAKAAYDKYQKALKARPDRAKNIIKYTDESLTESTAKKRVFADFTGSNTAFEKAYKAQLEKDGEENFEAVEDAEMKAVVAAVEAGENVVLYTTDDDYKVNCPEIADKANFKVVTVSRELTEDVEINKQMELYNEFVKYLQKMVEQDEDALEEAKKLGNKEVIAAIEKRLENSKAELKAALPATVKDEVSAEELPTPEEANIEDATENKEEPKEKKESLTESLRTWTCWYEGHDIGTVEAETEEEAAEEMMAKYPEYQYNNTDWGVSLEGEDLDEAAPQAASQLKRRLSTTEIMVKELKEHPLFNRLSTRTIQRVLLPYYIDRMGRKDLSTQAMIDFFTEEGFAPFVLDHFFIMDPLARKELLKADAKFMEIFNAYASEFKLFPGSKDDLVSGENEFDYAFSIAFDFGDENEAQDTEIARDTIKSFSKMYAAGKFDKSLVEDLKEDADKEFEYTNAALKDILKRGQEIDAEGRVAKPTDYDDVLKKHGYPDDTVITEAAGDNLDVLFNSEEFKKPISEKEVEAIKSKYEGLEEEIAPGIESEIAMKQIVDTWESVEDLDDESFNKLTEGYLTEVYSNVKSFEATSCDLKEGKLVVEGNITFNSGKVKPTTFVYEAKESADKKVVLEGLNADFATEKAFVLNCNLDKANCLIVESLNYKYSINETLVEGLVK